MRIMKKQIWTVRCSLVCKTPAFSRKLKDPLSPGNIQAEDMIECKLETPAYLAT